MGRLYQSPARAITADLQDKLYSTPTSAAIQLKHPIHGTREILGAHGTANPVTEPPRHDISLARVSVDHVVRRRSSRFPAAPAPAVLSECRIYVRGKGDDIHFQVLVVTPFVNQ